MDTSNYTYNGKLWKPCPTTSDHNNFFHSVFGVRTDEGGPYFDKQAKSRRMHWAAFLTYFENETLSPCLVDILEKCFSANDKYKHESFDENFEIYVSNVMVAKQSVTREEVPILATLENVKIVLLSNTKPDMVVIKPNARILGSYQNVSGKLKEVVLCEEGNVFTRLEPINEASGSKPSKTKVAKKTDPTKYPKGGSAGSKGVEYQVNLLALVILNALKKGLTQWKLSTENEKAGKFDDIVLEWSEGAILIQSKHKDAWRITLEDLVSTNTKHDDFSLPKYFLWFQIIKTEFNVKNVIICTNADINQKVLKFFDCIKANSDSSIFYKEGDCSYYMLNNDILSVLKEKTIHYFKQNFENKGLEESIITDENLEVFLKHLHLYFKYPPLKTMETIIENLLSSTQCSSNSLGQITLLEMYPKIMDWFQKKEGIYFTETHAKAMFSEIWRNKYCQKLEQYNLSFERNDLNFQNPKQIFHVTAKNRYLLQSIKIYQHFYDNKAKILYVQPDDDIETQKHVVDASELPQYVFLVIICPKTIEKSVIMEIYGKLKNLFNKYNYKKIILVAEDSKLAEQIGFNKIIQVDGSVTFEDLSLVSQKSLLNAKNIIFQGNRVSLEQLLPAQPIKDYGAVINSETLEKFVRREKIEVGRPPLDLHEHIRRFYINRTFRRTLDNTQDEECDSKRIVEDFLDKSKYEEVTQVSKDELCKEQSEIWSVENKEEVFSEESIYDVDEKLIIIANSAGMGKSTVLTKLAMIVKQNHPHLWVIKIELNDYTKILGESLEKGNAALTIKELLNSKKETELRNHLEKCTFSANQKVVLMLDGIDEISPDYTELIISMIKQCQEESNFAKILITTRTHLTQDLEATLNVKPFILEPLTEENQIAFLTNYWVYNLQMQDDARKEKCKRYAKALINNVLWTTLKNNKKNHFASLPLHLRMSAEIFQESSESNEPTNWKGCKEYVFGDEPIPKMAKKMKAKRLYDLFIEKKWDIFCKKENPEKKTWANQELAKQFNECRVCHRSLALELIVGEEKLRQFPTYQQSDKCMETNLMKIGIVQKIDNKYHFVHRTFADYFLAEMLVMELQENQTLAFQEFLIDIILLEPQYNVTRIFFDSFLKKIVDSLPPDIFNKYQSVNKEGFPELQVLQSKLVHTLIHALATTGCAAILQLILKCLRFKVIEHKGTGVANPDIEVESSIKGNSNTLDVLQRLVEKDGVNIKDKKARTPLHHAALNGCTDVMKILIQSAADVNLKDCYGMTVLLLAASSCQQDTITFLMEQGLDIHDKNDYDHNLLHLASAGGNLNTIKFFLELGLDSKLRDQENYMPLHLAARFGHLDVFKFLLSHDADFNVTGCLDRTPLHLAGLGGHLEIVRYLMELGADCNIKDSEGYTALHLAACFGQLDVIKFLVKFGLDFNVINNNGRTLLQSASANGHLDTVKYLLELGIDFNIRDVYGITAVHLAACFGHLDTVDFLKKYGANINDINNFGRSLIHSASAKGHLKMIQYLIEHGVDYKIKENNGNTALYLAAHSGQLDVVKFLIEKEPNCNATNNNGRTLLHAASAQGHLETVKFLLEQGADFRIRNNEGNTALYLAASCGHLDIVTLLGENGLDCNATNNFGSTPLHSASTNGHLEIIKVLLELGADIKIKDKQDTTALYKVVCFGHLHILKFLVDYGLDVNVMDNNRTLLHIATIHGRLEIVKFLFDLGVDYKIKGTNGNMAIHLAACFGHLDILKFFEEHGLDFNATGIFSRTPLHLASEVGHLEIVKFLLGLGVDYKVRDCKGFTALHLASCFGRLETIKFLVDYRLDINVKNNFGSTLLHSASAKGHLQTLEFLLEQGVDYKIRNEQGNTALCLAAYSGHLHIVKYLLEYGLDINVVGNHGRSLLHLASENHYVEVVQLLLDLGIDSTIRDDKGFTVLHLMVCFRKLETLKVLVVNGLDLNTINNLGRSLLHSASANGCLEIVKFLLEIGADFKVKDNEGNTALHLAIRFGNLETVKYLVEYGLDLNVTCNYKRTPLHLAASENGNLELVKLFLQLGVDFEARDKDGYTVLHLAGCFGRLDTVKFLVDYGLDVHVKNNNGRTILHSASANGHSEIVKFLLGLGVDFKIKDKDGYTALNSAARFGKLDIVKFLIEYDLDFNVMDNKNRTLLHAASANGHLEVVKLLVKLGVDYKVVSDSGNTVLHLAAGYGHLDTVKFLVDYDLDINARGYQGRTPLNLASIGGHLEIVKFLLGLGADFKIGDIEGSTPLHLASSYGKLETVKLLAEYFLDVNVKSNLGQTPLHLASANGHLDTVMFLVKLGADFRIRDNSGRTAFNLAARFRRLEVLRFLRVYELNLVVTNANG